MSEYWQPDIEILPREQLEAYQLGKLRTTLETSSRAPFYREVFRKLKITPDSVKSMADIRRLPITAKADLREHYPYGFLTLGREECVRLHCSSGTTGHPTVIFHTRHDLDSWRNIYRRLRMHFERGRGHAYPRARVSGGARHY